MYKIIAAVMIAWCVSPGSFVLFATHVKTRAKVVRLWDFQKEDDFQDWTQPNHLRHLKVRDGCLRADASGGDPFFSTRRIAVDTTPSQVIEIRYKTNRRGSADVFFTNTTETPYGGFLPEKRVPWNVIGDEAFHTARIFPGWNDEKRIVRLRIDFPNLAGGDVDGAYFEIDEIRIVDLDFENAPNIEPAWDFTTPCQDWTSPDDPTARPGPEGRRVTCGIQSDPFTFEVREHENWLSLEMASEHVPEGAVNAIVDFVSDTGPGESLAIPLERGRAARWYNVDTRNLKDWRGKIHLLQIRPEGNGAIFLKRILVSGAPQGPAAVSVEGVYLSRAINRVGQSCSLEIRLRNGGGHPARHLVVEEIFFPGLEIPVRPGDDGTVTKALPIPLPELKPQEFKTVTIPIRPTLAGEGEIRLTLRGEGAPETPVSAPVRFDRRLSLPQADRKSDYVPRPQPVESEFELGAFYFPGWNSPEAWERISRNFPQRKPVLGWYDEGDPEVVDWQIKWALENGIRYFLVDWYWDRQRRQLDHWLGGFRNARYKSMFRWAVMWANHNPPGSHDEEDQKTLTEFWIENYFNTPEYLTRDARPVVMIWSPQNMDRDMIAAARTRGELLEKGEGVKRLLEISQNTARKAGYGGIHFIAMKWPEASTDANDIQWLADAGFETTSIYHFMDHGGKAVDPMRFPFEWVVQASRPYMEARRETGILPFLPNLSTGWDARPWHGGNNIVIENRTVEGFRKICEDYRDFAEKTGMKRAVLAPLNEWGEGSYIEPNAEYGFQMYETLREVFCKKPQHGWPVNYAPEDVGLGPYDYN